MRRALAACVALTILASCGVDGAPVRPEPDDAPRGGVTVSGSATLGVSGGS